MAETSEGTNLPKVPHFDEAKPAHQLRFLLLQLFGKIYQYCEYCTLCWDEKLVSNEAFNLTSKVPYTEQIFARQLHSSDLNPKSTSIHVVVVCHFDCLT